MDDTKDKPGDGEMESKRWQDGNPNIGGQGSEATPGGGGVRLKAERSVQIKVKPITLKPISLDKLLPSHKSPTPSLTKTDTSKIGGDEGTTADTVPKTDTAKIGGGAEDPSDDALQADTASAEDDNIELANTWEADEADEADEALVPENAENQEADTEFEPETEKDIEPEATTYCETDIGMAELGDDMEAEGTIGEDIEAEIASLETEIAEIKPEADYTAESADENSASITGGKSEDFNQELDAEIESTAEFAEKTIAAATMTKDGAESADEDVDIYAKAEEKATAKGLEDIYTAGSAEKTITAESAEKTITAGSAEKTITAGSAEKTITAGSAETDIKPPALPRVGESKLGGKPNSAAVQVGAAKHKRRPPPPVKPYTKANAAKSAEAGTAAAPVKSGKKSKFLMINLLSFLVLLAAGGGFYLYRNPELLQKITASIFPAGDSPVEPPPAARPKTPVVAEKPTPPEDAAAEPEEIIIDEAAAAADDAPPPAPETADELVGLDGVENIVDLQEAVEEPPKLLESPESLAMAAAAGDAEAMFKLGELSLQDGDNRDLERSMAMADSLLKADDARGFEILKRVAEAGLFTAQMRLGEMFAAGTPPAAADVIQAVFWLETAAKQGDAQSKFALGKRLAEGEGIPRYLRKAEEWFALAAEENFPGAAAALSETRLQLALLLFAEGHHRPAMRWLEEPALAGDAEARRRVVKAYTEGLGVERDLVKAASFLEAAAAAGDEEAKAGLAALYRELAEEALTAENPADAFPWMVRAAELGDAATAAKIAGMLRDGVGCERDLVEAAEWFGKAAELGLRNMDAKAAECWRLAAAEMNSADRGEEERQYLGKAAEMGDAEAAFILGEAAFATAKTPDDFQEAAKWLAMAAAKNHPKASELLAECEFIVNIGKQEVWNALLTAAEGGDATARRQVGEALMRGMRGERDLEAAAPWLAKAERQGEPRAAVLIEELWYKQGMAALANGEPRLAVEFFGRAAARGFAPAERQLAKAYMLGEGKRRDLKRAVAWMGLAAEKGDAEALADLPRLQYLLAGDFFARRRHADAVFWALRSWEGEYPAAATMLGKYYRQGQHVERNLDTAAAMFRAAAELGNPEAGRLLAELYASGEGVPVDLTLAAEWMRQAAELGDPEASLIRRDYETRLAGAMMTTDPPTAFSMLDELARHGHPEAQLLLGRCYLSGIGVEEDLREAERWITRAWAGGAENAESTLVECKTKEAVKLYESDEFDKAYAILAAIGDSGDGDSKFYLGLCHLHGKGVERDIFEAEKWLAAALDDGWRDATEPLAECQVELGKGFHYGLPGFVKDASQAAEWFAKAADNDNSEGQYYLGLLHYDGELRAPLLKRVIEGTAAYGMAPLKAAAEWINPPAPPEPGHYEDGEMLPAVEIPKVKVGDYERASQLFAKAAEAGNPKAQFALGRCYYWGDGLGKNQAKSLEWMKTAAAKNNDDAQYFLGQHHFWSQLEKRGNPAAIEWFAKAAANGNPNAQYDLAQCLYHGYGVKQDHTKAAELFAKAAAQGDGDAISWLGHCLFLGHGVPRDIPRAVELQRQAAAMDNQWGLHRLGTILSEGLGGVPVDKRQAARLFLRAARQGRHEAQLNIGFYYLNGIGGMPRSRSQAKFWLGEAAKRGNSIAAKVLEREFGE